MTNKNYIVFDKYIYNLTLAEKKEAQDNKQFIICNIKNTFLHLMNKVVYDPTFNDPVEGIRAIFRTKEDAQRFVENCK